MAKKRKTFYINEVTIQQVKRIAQSNDCSENDVIETAVTYYEQNYNYASQYFTLPNTDRPLLLEAVDNLIYMTARLSEQTALDPIVKASLEARLEHLYILRQNVLVQSK